MIKIHEVTQEIIDEAKIQVQQSVEDTFTKCPIALTLSKSFGDVYIDVEDAQFKFGQQTIALTLSKEVQEWVKEFDTEKEVNPITVELEFWNCRIQAYNGELKLQGT